MDTFRMGLVFVPDLRCCRFRLRATRRGLIGRGTVVPESQMKGPESSSRARGTGTSGLFAGRPGAGGIGPRTGLSLRSAEVWSCRPAAAFIGFAR